MILSSLAFLVSRESLTMGDLLRGNRLDVPEREMFCMELTVIVGLAEPLRSGATIANAS